MRILQLGSIPPESGGRSAGGVATHSWELSTKLAANGHEVSLLANNFSSSSNPTQIEGVDVYGVSPLVGLQAVSQNVRSIPTGWTVFSWFDGFSLRARTQYVAYFFVCLDTVARFNPDVIHVHHAEVRLSPAIVATRAITPALPLVASIHSTHSVTQSDSDVTARFETLIRKNVQYLDNAIYVSRDVQDDFHGLFTSSENEWVVPNPIDLSRLSIPENPPDTELSTITQTHEHQLLCVGNLVKRKGIYPLIDAIKSLSPTYDIHLTIVGDGPERDRIRSYARKCGVFDRISFEGLVDDVSPYYNAADLFVLPSYSESFGIVYLEAMACGIPVIGTTAVPEIVVSGDGVCSIRVDLAEPDSLAEGIAIGLTTEWDPDRIQAFAAAFSWETLLERYEQIYAEVVAHG